MSSFSVQRIENGAFRENAWLAVCGEAGEAALVDPGADGPRIVAAARSAALDVREVILTHGHVDHISALPEVLAAFPRATVRLSPEDAAWCFTEENAIGPYEVPPPPPDSSVRPVRDGSEFRVGSVLFRAIATPGHSPGGTSYLALDAAAEDPSAAPLALFTGDTLFAGTIGRTDFPGSDPKAMEKSLSRLAALPPRTRVCPGHGPATTISRELATNPFLRNGN